MPRKLGLEEGLGAPEPLVADGDDLAVGKLVGLLEGGGGSSSGHLLLELKGNIAELLLDVADNLALSGGGERVATLGEDLHEVVGEFTASQVETEDGVGEGITFIDGDGVGDTIAGVHDDTGGTAGGVQGEDSLDGHIHGGHVEGLEHDLGHLLAVSLGVEGSLSQEDGLLLGGHAELVVEGVVPDLLHVVQLVMMPCSTGYLRVRIPLLDWASSPTYASFCPIPTMTPTCLGRPTMEGKTALGASSPAKPALHMPEPLSQTRAATSSSHILGVLNLFVVGYLSTQLGGLPM